MNTSLTFHVSGEALTTKRECPKVAASVGKESLPRVFNILVALPTGDKQRKIGSIE